MALHESLNPAQRTGSASDANGRWVPVAGRTGDDYPWTVTVDVGDVETGATVTVRVEASQRRSDDDAVTVHTFGQLSTPAQQSAEVTLSGYLRRGYLRTVANINGTVTVGTTEEAAFFVPHAETSRLRSQLQSWATISGASTESEKDLLQPYRQAGGYRLFMDQYGFSEDMRAAVALQVQRRFQRWALGKSNDPKEQVQLEEMDMVDATAKDLLTPYAVTTVRRVFF